MNHPGNFRLVGAGHGDGPGIDCPRRSQDRQQQAVTVVGSTCSTEAAIEIAPADLQQPLKALGTAERVGPCQQGDQSRRTQFSGARDVTVVTRGKQRQVAALVGYPEPLAERGRQAHAARFMAVMTRQEVGRCRRLAEIVSQRGKANR